MNTIYAGRVRFVFVVILLTGVGAGAVSAEEHARNGAVLPDTAIEVRLVAEAGFLGVTDHRIRYSADDPAFRYHEDGGQDVLFPFYRLSAEMEIGERHTVIFLYQPLTVRTSVEMPPDFVLDGRKFSGDTLDLLYNFPFYRLSYMREVFRGPRLSAAAGGSLQIRNATIEFEGSQGGFYRSAGIGPVPLLKARARYAVTGGLWLESEIDGVYAPISYLNGSDNDTVGALLDASVRVGYTLNTFGASSAERASSAAGRRVEPFLNLRYLGGGAANKDPADYTVNWLNVVTLSLGINVDLGQAGRFSSTVR